MKRLAWAFVNEARMLYRSGSLLAALSLGLFWILFFAGFRAATRGTGDLVASAPGAGAELAAFLSALILAFHGMAMIMERERSAGVFLALDLTPLRPHEYLAAKAAALAMISLLPAGVIGAIGSAGAMGATAGAGIRMPHWLAGAALLGVIGALAGFLAAACSRSRSAFLMGWWVFPVLCAPALRVGSMGALAPFHPLWGPLSLMRACGAGDAARTIYAMGASLLWLALALVACRPALERWRRPRSR